MFIVLGGYASIYPPPRRTVSETVICGDLPLPLQVGCPIPAYAHHEPL